MDNNTEMLQKILSQVEENSLILRALEENSKTHGAKLESLDNRLSHVEGSVKRVDNNIERIEGNIQNIEGDIKGIKDNSKRTNNIANLALNHAAQNRLDIADLKQ